MQGEAIAGWGGADPDDLAVVICSALHKAGKPFRVRFAFAGGRAEEIHVHSGDALVCTLKLYPLEITREFSHVLANMIETLARLQSARR